MDKVYKATTWCACLHVVIYTDICMGVASLKCKWPYKCMVVSAVA